MKISTAISIELNEEESEILEQALLILKELDIRIGNPNDEQLTTSVNETIQGLSTLFEYYFD